MLNVDTKALCQCNSLPAASHPSVAKHAASSPSLSFYFCSHLVLCTAHAFKCLLSLSLSFSLSLSLFLPLTHGEWAQLHRASFVSARTRRRLLTTRPVFLRRIHTCLGSIPARYRRLLRRVWCAAVSSDLGQAQIWNSSLVHCPWPWTMRVPANQGLPRLLSTKQKRLFPVRSTIARPKAIVETAAAVWATSTIPGTKSPVAYVGVQLVWPMGHGLMECV